MKELTTEVVTSTYKKVPDKTKQINSKINTEGKVIMERKQNCIKQNAS